MNGQKKNLGILAIFAFAFLMLTASFAPSVSATETQGFTIQNGVWHAGQWNVTDNFIDVAYSVIGTSPVHNVTIQYQANGTANWTTANVITVGYNTTNYIGDYIIPGISNGIYHVQVKVSTGVTTFTNSTIAAQTVKVVFGGSMPYLPTGITNKSQFVDYLYFGATIMTLFLIFSLIRLKMYKSKDKIIEHELMIMFASFVLAIVIWMFIGNPLGYIWNEIIGFFTGIYNWIIGMWNAYL